METPKKPNPDHKATDAEAHIRSAQQILKALQEKIGEHPEIGAALWSFLPGCKYSRFASLIRAISSRNFPMRSLRVFCMLMWQPSLLQ